MLLPPSIQVCPVEIPGRGRREGEAALSTVSALAEALAHALPLQVASHSIVSRLAMSMHGHNPDLMLLRFVRVLASWSSACSSACCGARGVPSVSHAPVPCTPVMFFRTLMNAGQTIRLLRHLPGRHHGVRDHTGGGAGAAGAHASRILHVRGVASAPVRARCDEALPHQAAARRGAAANGGSHGEAARLAAAAKGDGHAGEPRVLRQSSARMQALFQEAWIARTNRRNAGGAENMHACLRAQVFEKGNFAGLEDMKRSERLFNKVAPMGVNDIMMAVQYRHRERPPLALPIVALDGLLDATIDRGNMAQWAGYTRGPFRSVPVEGDHYFVASRFREASAIHALHSLQTLHMHVDDG